ncbi:hypothetical protein [Bacillus subtilis]|uniref:hypothetical protein n=1 Tax=Bacillus subtilis TaxID=1423 RepID=UPI002B4BCDEE|nr:hypothetical protein [Bacillus subtilis]MEC0314961.1 hypothetical protein [Bacillus subtilis]MEC0320110.1 hypothetical protein [Bacillus subtilis]MEC0365164.1 hypothetical protein [Bacillus subtilis]MEC0392867.1 hypothetical protein [Bacillus subtilis]MEC0400304.1 hypothetical protein [Bacillus subtilis]
MSLDIEQVLKDLELERFAIDQNQIKIRKLRRKQEEAINKLLDEYDQVMSWFVKKKIAFTSPKLRGNSFMNQTGPVVGFDERNKLLFVYNYITKQFQSVNIYDQSHIETKDLRILIEEGYFEDIVSGIKHTLVHQKEILEAQKKLIDGIEAQLSNC